MIHAYAAMAAGEKLQPFEYDPGELKVDDVEIEIDSSGLCHSDLSMINNEWGASRYPLVAGHEVIGRITAVGESVNQFTIGQAVGLGWHSGYCNDCQSCHQDDQNLCAQARPTIIGRHGGFADRVRAQASSVVALPDGIDHTSAGPLFCGGVTVFNPIVQFNVKPGDRVAIIGIGGLGHLALQFFSAWGCEVTAFTSTQAKTDEALSLGASDTLNSRDDAAIKSARNRFDMILSTVNVPLDWALYLQTLAPKGRLNFVGIPVDPMAIRVQMLLGKQLSISGSPVGSPSTISQMLAFAAKHDIKPVIEEYAFSDINEAIERLHHGKVRYRAVLSHTR